MDETILIERSQSDPRTYYLRYESALYPFGYVQRCGDKWWAAIPHGGVCGYFSERKFAIAALI